MNNYDINLLYRYIFVAVFVIVRAIILSIAVRHYNESIARKEKKSLYGFIFVFGLIAVIIYLIKSNKQAQSTDSPKNFKKNKTIFWVLIVVYVILFVIYEVVLMHFSQIISYLNIPI
ncbi:MAG: hypothetical protein LUG21_00465 [Clostridiales bacterium]|nr:hypothetical protein [Clostridiales bacterium]